MTTNNVDEDLRRELRWISYAKPKTLLGFDHLGPAYLPSMSLKPKGYSICFDKVGGWSPPNQLIREVRNNNCELSLQLSLSFFHTASKTFFGSTWMGQEVHVGDSTDVIDFDYSDIVYLISRINDSSCIGVVEVVASLIDTKRYITIGQYGCGWTMINLFNSSRETFHDISDGYEGVQSSSSTFLLGTPRDLLLYDPTEWKNVLKEMKGCTLSYRGFGHRKLLKISRLIAENEPVGKYDPIAGILPKDVVTSEGKKPMSVPCLADEEVSDGKKGILCLPSNPTIAIPLELKVVDFQILIPNRSQIEEEMVASVIRDSVETERSQAKILQRSAKICFHNGHTVVGGEWKSYRLIDDKDDRDILLLNEETITIDGYVPNDKMALSILIEYEIGLPSENHTYYNPQAMFNSAISTDKSITTLVLGAALFVPSDGKVLFLRNQSGKSKSADSMGIELKMRNDDVCSWLSPKPLFDMSKLRKFSKSLNNRRGKSAKDEDDDVDEASIIAFDLHAFDPVKGELSHLDDVDVREGDSKTSKFRDYDAAEEKSYSKKNRMDEEKYSGAKADVMRSSTSSKKPSYKVSTKSTRRERDDDEESVAESLVEGNSDVCSLRLDPHFYSGRGDADSDAFSVASFRSDNRISVPKDRNSLLYQSMNTKLHTAEPRKQLGGEIIQAREVLESDSVLEHFKADSRRETLRAAPKTDVSAPAYTLRELSRGARSRLSRHGYSGVIQDSTGYLDNLQNRATVRQAAVDILLEAGDSLSINDITIQFAGYRAGAKGLNSASVAYPRAVYFSYQFYSCQPTRTEPMRLLPADIGQVSVLARDEAHARDEIPLALRYIIDTGAATPTEAIEFAEYLANKTLYIDVWDADSLILLGTCGIPLRRIMRQGQPMAKCALECDVINSDAASNVQSGITSSTIVDGGPISGTLVGSVDVIICNYGQEGRSESKGTDSRKKVSDPIEGLNWRAITNQGEKRSEVKNRPKNCVRAKPLAESAPELSQALRDHRQSSDGTKNVMRSLTATRGMEGVHTLTYDEVVVLFKRFQGSVKGTVQYSGALLRLLDLPSFNVAVRKLIQAFQIARSGHEVEKDMMRFADANGTMNISSLQEFFKFLFDRHGIAYRQEELGILASKFNNEKTAINVKDVVTYCQVESEHQDWAVVGKLIRRSVQKATLEGQDVGQMLAEYDPHGEQFISAKDFRAFLHDLSAFGKLSPNDIAITIRHFSESSESRKNTSTPVSLREVMAFLGGQYVGNVNARIAKIIISGVDGQANRTVHEFIRALRLQDKKGEGLLTYDSISSTFATYDVTKELSHDQIKTFLSKVDKKKVGYIEIDELVNALGLHETGGNDLPSVLQILIERAKGNGASITGLFRALDVDGNGLLSSSELLTGLKQLQIIDNSNEALFKAQIPDFMKKFDEDGEGNISLKEFLNFLGIKDYTPSIIQRMTKYFAVAISKGLSFDDIFKQLDTKKSGSLNVDDLSKSLKNMGVDIDEKDKAEFKVFDKDGDGSITLTEFMDFFKTRVNKVRNSKRLEAISAKFLDIMKTVLAKVSVEQLFKHFDKDGGGSVSSQEFKVVLKKLPQFKNLSDDDLEGLTQILDEDNSGEVTLNEFKAFVENSIAPQSEKNSAKHIEASKSNLREEGLKRLHQIFITAKEKGLSIDRIFGSIDKDKSGSITLKELRNTLQKMKQFDNVNESEMDSMLSSLDTDHSGTISLDEFIYFIDYGVPKKKTLKVNYHDEKGSKNMTPKQIFIAQITRIAEPDGGIKGFLAFLDDDEDGLIEKSALTRQLKREGVYEKISESDADKIIDSVSSGGKINIINLMKLLEGNHTSSNEKSNTVDDDFEGIPLVDYDFSSDPETRALEKKMRNLGRTLAKKGMDVEGLFKTHDLRDTGMIRRSEFIECMSTMGLYILEQGKVIDDALNADDDVRKLQIQQINKIKGVTSGSMSYAQNASRAARKLVLNDNSQGDFNEHLESMALVNWYRQSQKKLLLQRVLSHSLASNINLYPRFGKTLFFEYPLTNPFGHEERFVIDVSDPELRLVTSFEEWMHLRKTCRPCTGDLGDDPVEADMFDRDGYGNVQVALLPHETLYIPFTLMTLIPYTSQDALVAQKKLKFRADKSESKSSSESKSGESKSGALSRGESKSSGSGFDESKEEPARMIEVKMISGTHGHIVSVLRVSICPRPYVVDRTIRFFEPENCVMRRRIRLVGGFRESTFPGEFSLSSKYVHCVEGNYAEQNQSSSGVSKVVVEFGPSNNSGELDLFIRYKCGTFPSVGDFHLLLYDDPFQSQLHEIWHVIVQSRQRLDVNSSVGGNAAVDLVVRGDKFARRARAFASPTVDVVKFRPESTFQVVPGAYNRVEMNYFASQIGSRRMQVNLVDVDTRELLNAWILTTTVSAPAAMRTYDVEVSRGRGTNKKIIFKNPWETTRRFQLVSSNEKVMKPRSPYLDVAPQGSAYLRLWFSGSDINRSADVYLFLNDEQGNNEESFLFHIKEIN